MKDEKILRKAIEKAIDNGMPIGTSKEAIFGNNQIEFLVSIGAYYNTIFSHSFAKALNFKLKDLGAWCDEGKEPLKFIEKLI